MPMEMARSAGRVVLQYVPALPMRIARTHPMATITAPTDKGSRGPMRAAIWPIQDEVNETARGKERQWQHRLLSASALDDQECGQEHDTDSQHDRCVDRQPPGKCREARRNIGCACKIERWTGFRLFMRHVAGGEYDSSHCNGQIHEEYRAPTTVVDQPPSEQGCERARCGAHRRPGPDGAAARFAAESRA